MMDVLVVAGPRINHWPTAGARALSIACSEFGLQNRLIGGDTLVARGMIPDPGVGGTVIASDPRGAISSYRARSIIRVANPSEYPDPFPGCNEPCLVPLQTVYGLHKKRLITAWGRVVVILGTGTAALRFGAHLLRNPQFGIEYVYCVETARDTLRFSGWEVAARQFETRGGKIISGQPHSLTSKSAQVWELRIEDDRGIRVIEVRWVIAAGPFGKADPGIREYPPGSFLFELTHTAPPNRVQDPEGWLLEEERARGLAARLAKALLVDLGDRKDLVERVLKKSRSRLKYSDGFREKPFRPTYDGKWLDLPARLAIQTAPGMPKTSYTSRKIAAIECVENISCDLCVKTCPERAIEPGPRLLEEDCTACGVCVAACPHESIVLMQERTDRSTSTLSFPWNPQSGTLVAGKLVHLLNRRGEDLGTARVAGLESIGTGEVMVEVDVPHHLLWDARGISPIRTELGKSFDHQLDLFPKENDLHPPVEILLNDERRFLKSNASLTEALFAAGLQRAGDRLACSDGSCGLCVVTIEEEKKPACQVQVQRGLSVQVPATDTSDTQPILCSCLGLATQTVVDRIRMGHLKSPEAVLSVVPVGSGVCHGQCCVEAFRRLLVKEGVSAAEDWIDWKFPWSDWRIS
ncbi:MAG: 4Fe-4S binding protein [Bdellovibrionota bacterium]